VRERERGERSIRNLVFPLEATNNRIILCTVSASFRRRRIHTVFSSCRVIPVQYITKVNSINPKTVIYSSIEHTVN
jgi:hypothetical protein